MEDPEQRAPRRRLPRLALVGTGLVVAVGVAGAAVALSGGSEPEAAPSPTPLQVLTPVGLKAETSFSPFQITLTWSTPVGGAQVTKYEVRQGSKEIGSLAASITSLVDRDVEPGTNYVYSVVALSGDRRSDPAVLPVELPMPLLSEARLSGSYTLSARASSHSGFSRFQEKTRFDLMVTPNCRRGACDVTVRLSGVEDLRFRLHRNGARYTGSDKGKFDVGCGEEALMVSRVELELRVIDAAAVRGIWVAASEWVAFRLKGTLVMVQDPQLGCDGSEAEYDLTVAL